MRGPFRWMGEGVAGSPPSLRWWWTMEEDTRVGLQRPRTEFPSSPHFLRQKTESTQRKTPSLEKTNALSPTLQGPENHASCDAGVSPSAPTAARISSSDLAKLWQLHRTGLLAIWISKPAAPFDAECEARGVSSLLPADSRRTLSQRTNDRPLPRRRPPVWPFLKNSGCVRSFFLLAAVNAAPSVSAVPGRAIPTQCKEEIKVVSIASCVPPNYGNPSATISNRRASPGFGAAKSISRTMTLVVTRAPPSRQILEVALSTAKPLLPKTPAQAQAVR